MKKWLVIFSLLSLFITSAIQANIVKAIQEKNGDVYVLVRPKSGGIPSDSTGLWHYKRTLDYTPNRLPLSDDSRIVNYEGLSVDKFGHVKLFRTDSRNSTSLWTLLEEGNKYPGTPECKLPLGKATYEAVTSYGGFNGGCRTANTSNLDSINFGWSYAINTATGEEGWYCLYPEGTYDRAYVTNNSNANPMMINCRFERTETMAKSWEADVYRHAKVITSQPTLNQNLQVFPPIRVISDPRRHPEIKNIAGIRGQPWGLPVGFLAHGRGHFIVGYDKIYNPGGNGPRRHGEASPLLGWFWARNNILFSQPEKQNARRISDLMISRSKLFMEEFITAEDNELIKNSTAAGFDFVEGEDYFTSSNCNDPNNYTGSGFLHCRNTPIDTAYAFGEELEKYNDCSDLCGQPAQTPTMVNAVINKGRAKFSSAGASQNLQRAYIIKKYYPIAGSQDDTYGVFQIDGSSLDSFLDWENDSLTYKSSGILSDTNGAGILRQFNTNDYMIAYNFGAAQGGNGNVRSLQTSKRIAPDGDDSKDFIYVSDLAPSHFNVSSSFWGTGGMVWWAAENGNNLTLNYEQYNHFQGTLPLTKGSIDIANATPLVAFGADGDNFVYILHGGGNDLVENISDIDRLISPKTEERVLQLCNQGGRIHKGCDGSNYSYIDNGYVLHIEVNRYAGLKLEKIAPLPGSKPVRIGTVPLQSEGGAICGATLFWPGPPDMPAPALNSSGTILAPGWTCSGANDRDIQNILDDNLIEMAIINVANPPASGGDLVMDIVEPKPVNHIYKEDTVYSFNMENPPRFNGPIAQLSLSGNSDTNIYGDVQIISNYDESGINLMKEILTPAGWIPGTDIPAGSTARSFYDNDDKQGKMLSSFIFEDLQSPGGTTPLMNDSYGFSNAPQSSGVKTLRYRWRVKAVTPPHSFKDYEMTPCVGLLMSGNGATMTNATSLTQIGLLEPVTGNENLMNNEPGVLFDSCWQDFGTNNSNLGELDNISTGIPDVINPPTLNYKFNDPGVYNIQLWVGGLRFFADDFTFLDNPATISMVLDATNTVSTIRVGATTIANSDESIKSVVIANNDLESSEETRSAIYGNSANARSNLASNSDDMTGPQGRFPVLPVGNYDNSSPLIVTYQNQQTPIVAEAEIQFFRLKDLVYHERNLTAPGQSFDMSKHKGVGVWDYEYPGGGSIPFGSNFTFNPIDKSSQHPANWSTRSTGNGAGIIATDDTSLDERRGYDASGNYETGRGYENGTLIVAAGEDAQFQAAHQGTLASDDAFPSNYLGRSFDQNLISHPEALYTWWEIKYAWFLRYTKPNGEVVKEVLRTGNLAEVFLMNHMSKNSSSWQRLVRNLAPYNLKSDGSAVVEDDKPLMWYVGDEKEDRKIKVRIPLFNRNAMLTGSKNDEMHGVFSNLAGFDSNIDFNSLYSQIHPMQFNTPTEPTVLEIGFQLFFPMMSWSGRDENIDGTFNYYDAVYWGPQSKSSGFPDPTDFTKIALPFGTVDTLNIWPILAKQKLPGPTSLLDAEASGFGLKLVAAINNKVPGGFDGTSNTDDIQYIQPGNTKDDFVEVAVLDMIAPKVTLIEGGSQTANTGGRVDQDIIIEVEDNNPYAVWPSYQLIGEMDDRLRVPALVEYSYEVGFDPRNAMGLGLKNRGSKPQRAYGFNLSYTNLKSGEPEILNIADLPQYRPNDQSGKPIRDLNPGFSYNPDPIEADQNDFYFPYQNVGNGLFWDGGGVWYLNKEKPFVRSADQDTYKNSWDRFNQLDTSEKHKLYPPQNKLTDTGVRTENPTQNHSGLSKWLIRFVPDVNNESPYDILSKHPDGPVVEYLESNPGSGGPDDYEAWNDSCLNGTFNPTEANHSDCKIRTRWRISKEKTLAPVFMNSNDNTLKFYAKARDVRISENWPNLDGITWNSPGNNFMNGDFGTWPKYDFSRNWKRRMGAEDYGNDPGTPDNNISDLVNHFYNNNSQRYSTELGGITVTDNDIPNVHITLYEYKGQTEVEFATLSAQGNNPYISEDSEDVLIFRSKDKRNQIDEFKSGSLYEQANNQPVININSIKAGMDLVNQAFHIPEDVRFMIQIKASDNKDLDEISISASSHSNPSSIFTPPSNYVHVSNDPSNKPFEMINSSAGRIYNQAKVARGYHLYPNSGVYDVISVEVADAANNKRVVNIPIIVIPQDVHFRSLGSQNKGR